MTIWYMALAALGFGFVIFIHELGHFLFAKWAGVQVDRFSIGFGPVIFRKQIGETEYALSLLPFGGYVKMLGQEDLPENVPASDRVNPRSYLAKSPAWQAIILLGGVLFNLISSYVILLCLAWHGLPVIEPVVGDVQQTIDDRDGQPQPSPAARLGLKASDRILSANGKLIRSFDDLSMVVVTASGPITLLVNRSGTQVSLPADGTPTAAVYDYGAGRPTLGIRPPYGWRIQFVEHMIGKPGERDPQPGDRLIAIDGAALPEGITGQRIEDLLTPHTGSAVRLTLQRGDATIDTTIRYAGNGSGIDQILNSPVRITAFGSAGDKPSPAQEAGLHIGDVVVKVDDKLVTSVSSFFALTRAALNTDRATSITVWREGNELSVSVQGADLFGVRRLGLVIESMSLGYLPLIPPGVDGKPGGLGQAGVVAGDAIVTLAPSDKKAAEPTALTLTIVSGGKPVLLSMADADYYKTQRGKTPSPLMKLVGAKATPALRQQLASVMIDNTGGGAGFPGPGFIQVTDGDGVKRTVNLSVLSPATQTALISGLQPGDWLTGIDALPDGGHGLSVVRGAGKPRTVTVPLRDLGVALSFGIETRPYQLHGWTEAFSIANDAAYNMIVKTLQIIPRFFRSSEDGGIDANKALTGPIGIFSALKGSAEHYGFDSYLNLVALIGLNLFLVNLLPIPITDGGQLVFLAIETVIRRPLPAAARNVAAYIGLAMVVGLMLYVVGLDVSRLFG